MKISQFAFVFLGSIDLNVQSRWAFWEQ